MGILPGLRGRMRAFWSRARAVPAAARAIASMLPRLAAPPAGDRPVLVVQAVEDTFYLGLFSQLATAIALKHPTAVEFIEFRSLNEGEFDSAARFLVQRLVAGPTRSAAWRRLYSSFGHERAFSSTQVRPIGDLSDAVLAWRAWRKLDGKDALLALEFDGTPIGDLVYDSYLRFRPSHTVRLDDPYVLVLVWQALRDLRRARGYFTARGPALLLSSYSTYIQHGIPVRVALQSGSEVLSFSNFQQVAKRLSPDDWLHTPNGDSYAAGFERVGDKAAAIDAAESALSARIRGEVDAATAYMRTSAYSRSGDAIPDVSGAVIVFLHDFYDSPHVYADMVFADFWDWIRFTIDTLDRAGLPYLLKAHPNQVDRSSAVVEALAREYPALRFLPAGVSNVQLAQGGMRCAVTVYGTVAHEMAFLGIPTIACARHPHVSFSFCTTARTVQEYGDALAAAGGGWIGPERARAESLAFYHMHNSNGPESERTLMDALIRLRIRCADPAVPPGEIAGEFAALARLDGWTALAERCAALLR